MGFSKERSDAFERLRTRFVGAFREGLQRTLEGMGDFKRARMGKRLPEVLTPSEVDRILSFVVGVLGLMIKLMYGSGLRLMECARLRVKDLDFER